MRSHANVTCSVRRGMYGNLLFTQEIIVSSMYGNLLFTQDIMSWELIIYTESYCVP
jgi:hypothetical protein